MTVEEITEGAQMLKSGGDADDAIESAIRKVEDFLYYESIGYGRLPDEEMKVEMDVAFMDGDALSMDAIAAIKDFANPVSITRRLSHEKVNSLLAAEGAKRFAHKEGFERRNMLVDRAEAHYRKRIRGMPAQAASQKPKPYFDRDAVDTTCLDMVGKMTVATSTSGLFMKKKGRVGDSPISGSGFYADSKRGAASATGLGEDLMKDCISYEIVRLMGESMHLREACETAMSRPDTGLKERRDEAGDLSTMAMDPKGEWGMATNIEGFSPAVVTESQEPAVYLVTCQEDGRCTYKQAPDEWMENYMKTRMAPIEE